MKSIEKAINVNVPLGQAYNQWTQSEEPPLFMEGIKEVRPLDDTHVRWKAEIGGRTEEWDAEIFQQVPDQQIAWRSLSGANNSGRISFASLGGNQTRVNLHLEYESEGIVENIGDALGVVSARVAADLERFKEFIESQRSPTRGWRAEIHDAVKQSTNRAF